MRITTVANSLTYLQFIKMEYDIDREMTKLIIIIVVVKVFTHLRRYRVAWHIQMFHDEC